MSFIYIIHTASVCCNFFTVIICYIVIFLQYIIHIISILYETKHILPFLTLRFSVSALPAEEEFLFFIHNLEDVKLQIK